MLVILILFGVLIGLSLGLTGAGGSILAVPLLIYGADIEPLAAIHISLLVVTMTAVVGVASTLKSKAVSVRAGLIFAVTGMVAAPLGIKAGSQISPDVLVTGFALLMIAVAVNLWRKAVTDPGQASVVRAGLQPDEAGAEPVCRYSASGRLTLTAPCAVVLAASGLLAGGLSGLFGVGGGFVIVPILMAVTQMDIHRAVATSLMVIALIGASGSSAILFTSEHLQWGIALPFIVGGAAGMLAGRMLATRLAGSTLQKIFSIAVLAIGLAMLGQQWLGA